MRSTDALAWNITDLPADLYLIEVVVTDAYVRAPRCCWTLK